MAAPSSASQAALTTHSSIDEVSEPRRVPHEIFLAILDELIAVFEASTAGALWNLTAEFPTSLLPYVETLSIPYISPPDRFARIFSDFSNVRLFLIESQCRDWSKRFNDKHKLCSHGNLLPVNENLLPILQADSPDRQSIEKALDRGARVILKRYIDQNDVEVFSTQKGLRVKFSHCEFKCACDANRRDWLERKRYLLGWKNCLPEG
ncbi:hypothetical protein K4K56_003274 [Colletotrichum sp. SAR 10_98]|nr:hypothetical protein K4K56_003274 [Colletotrichum sp. SAR 10_98]